MIDSEIFKIAGQLKDVVNKHKANAEKALLSLPEGKTKEDLKSLLRKASSGKVRQEDAQRELAKIIKNNGG